MSEEEKSHIDLFITQVLDLLDGKEQTEKLELIEDILHRFNFEKRLAILTKEQLEHMHDTSIPLWLKEKLDKCSTEGERKPLFEDFARTRYFRKCAWMDYLNGSCSDPPCPANNSRGSA